MATPCLSPDEVLARLDYGRALKAELLMEPSSDTSMPHSQPLRDAVDLFESLGIGYALIGGIAAMIYGRARFTEDVDFVAASGHMDVLAAHPAKMAEFHFDPACTWKLYHMSGVEVDIWKDDRVESLIARARVVTIAGRTVRLIDPNDLAAMKLRARRRKDDADISAMIQSGTVDEAVVRKLVSDDEFAHFLDIRQRP